MHRKTHTHTHGEREGERERLSMDPNYTLSTHTSTRYHSYLKWNEIAWPTIFINNMEILDLQI